MASNVNLVTVKVSVNGKEQTIQMEKGLSFENKGGIYNVDENGQLKKFDKSKNLWANASDIKMTNYQWKAFNNVANNDGNAKTYTKADIEKAKEYYSQGKFRTDMAQDLPEGYKIEKASKPEENTLAVRVSNGKDSQSATLKFSFIDTLSNLVKADKKSDANTVVKTETLPRHDGLENVTKKTYADGSYVFVMNEKSYQYYHEYYSNGKKKVSFQNDRYEPCLTIYDQKGNILFEEDINISAISNNDEPEYDSKGRLLNSYNYGRFVYDDKNKTVTRSYRNVYTKYKMDSYGEPDYGAKLSEVYIGETGRKIDLMNNGVEKLLQELNVKGKIVKDNNGGYSLVE